MIEFAMGAFLFGLKAFLWAAGVLMGIAMPFFLLLVIASVICSRFGLRGDN